jgi:hypothetical protein
VISVLTEIAVVLLIISILFQLANRRREDLEIEEMIVCFERVEYDPIHVKPKPPGVDLEEWR